MNKPDFTRHFDKTMKDCFEKLEEKQKQWRQENNGEPMPDEYRKAFVNEYFGNE